MRRLRLFTLIFLLAGCAPIPNLWGSSLPPAPTPTGLSQLPGPTLQAAAIPVTATFESTATIPPATTEPPGVTPAATATVRVTPTPAGVSVKRVLIISFDGMRTDAIEAAPMPNLMELMKTSAYNLTNARTIDYSSTSPSHASMLSGLCVEDHGMIYDKYFIYMGYSKGVDIFDLAHAAEMRTVMIVSKDKLRQLAEPETTDVFKVAYGEPAILRAVLPEIDKDFGLMLIHFAGPDLRGHKYGWMSGEYLKVLRIGDEALGTIFQELKDKGLFDSTLIIVTADHGGHDKNHIGTVIEDYRIPWIAHGPGVAPQELTLRMYTMDTAATAAYALGLPLQPDWDGIPIFQIFGEPQTVIHEKYPCKT